MARIVRKYKIKYFLKFIKDNLSIFMCKCTLILCMLYRFFKISFS